MVQRSGSTLVIRKVVGSPAALGAPASVDHQQTALGVIDRLRQADLGKIDAVDRRLQEFSQIGPLDQIGIGARLRGFDQCGGSIQLTPWVRFVEPEPPSEFAGLGVPTWLIVAL